MYEGITQQNLKQAVPPAWAFIFPTGNLLGAQSFIFSSVVKFHQKNNPTVLLVFWLIFLANIFSTFMSECSLYENNMWRNAILRNKEY